MPPLGDWSGFLSVIGSLSLGLGKGLFEESKPEEASFRLCLEDLGARQRESLLAFVDSEVGRSDARGDNDLLEGIRETERLRDQAAVEILNRLWEDAITGRRLEDSYVAWCRHERTGKSACVVGFFANLGLVFVAVFGQTLMPLGSRLFTFIAALVLVIPWIVVLVARVSAEGNKRYVMEILESPKHGFPHERKFGGE